MKVKWLIDTSVSERGYQTGFPTLAQAARDAGHEVYETKYLPFSDHPDPNIPWTDGDTHCVVTHGSIQFIKQLQRAGPTAGLWWTPGPYFNDNVKNFHKYAVHIGSFNLLNNHYILLPFKEFLLRLDSYLEKYTHGVFIKPNSGMKEFTGKVLTIDNWETEIATMQQYEKVSDDSLVVISPALYPNDMNGEFRYIIADGKVVTGSEYRWDNILDVRRDTHPDADKLAKKIAEQEWQADRVYVCDIMICGGLPFVIELNAFSSSGLYACDTNKIVEALSAAAWKEYSGDD